jgi:hypothetical protein
MRTTHFCHPVVELSHPLSSSYKLTVLAIAVAVAVVLGLRDVAVYGRPLKK